MTAFGDTTFLAAGPASERIRYPVLRTTLNRLRKGMEPK